MERLSLDVVGQQKAHPIRILQFGGGHFLRAFADYLIEVLNETGEFDAGVALVKPTPNGDYTSLRRQDGLFHILIQGVHNGQTVRHVKRIQCIRQIIHPYRDWQAYLDTATIPELRFVISNTTEAGIAFQNEPFPPDHPAKEFPGKLAQWLYYRYQHFGGAADKGCVFLPCELIADNGQQLKEKILAYAASWQLGENFEAWIKDNNVFCNTLVDRIVPGAPEDPGLLWQQLGLEDHQMVTAEPYLLWAIEAPREIRAEMPFNRTAENVVFTEDLEHFRTLKVRILNGAHTAMVSIGILNGIYTVRDFIENDKWGGWLEALLREEIAPTLPYTRAEIENNISAVLDRFRNPYINHKLSDIALNSISKFRVRLLPTIMAYHQKTGKVPDRIAESLAALIRMYRGDLSHLPRDTREVADWFEKCWSEHDVQTVARKTLSKNELWSKDLSFMQKAVLAHIQKYG